MHIVAFAGSLRKDSFNKKNVKEAIRLAQELDGVTAEFVDLQPLDIPIYDGDVEDKSGIPADVLALAEKITKADALIISTPEYNGSISSPLKNVVDWLSRQKPVSITGKHLLICAASTGALGGVRGLWHTRIPFEVLGMHVYPTMLGLPKANEAFDENGRLKDEKALKSLVEKFVGFVKG